jgi:hypothetical protein
MGALFVYVFLTVCTTKVYIAGVNSGCAAGSWELILCTPAALYYIFLCFKFFGKNQGQEQIGAVGALILILVLIYLPSWIRYIYEFIYVFNYNINKPV